LRAAHNYSAGISVTQGAILRFYAPQGRQVSPIGMKFGVEESTEGGLFHAKFHPIGAGVGVWGPQN